MLGLVCQLIEANGFYREEARAVLGLRRSSGDVRYSPHRDVDNPDAIDLAGLLVRTGWTRTRLDASFTEFYVRAVNEAPGARPVPRRTGMASARCPDGADLSGVRPARRALAASPDARLGELPDPPRAARGPVPLLRRGQSLVLVPATDIGAASLPEMPLDAAGRLELAMPNAGFPAPGGDRRLRSVDGPRG